MPATAPDLHLVTPAAKWLTPIYENIPALLREHDRWFLWTLDGEARKVPRAVAKPHINIDASKSKHWCSLDKLLTAKNLLNGPGFALGAVEKGPTFAGVDLDDCRDLLTGKIDAWAQDIIRAFNSYTEISPSGTGVKIFLTGTLRDEDDSQRKVYQLEVYDRKRYFTVTGHHLTGTPTTVEPREAQLRDLYARQQSTDLTALCKLFGLYLSEKGEYVNITCPWADEHSEADHDRDAALHRDAEGHVDGFHCFHSSHAETKKLPDVLKRFAIKQQRVLPASAIVIEGGKLTDIVDRAQAALLKTPIYQRGGLLTRAIKLDTATGDIKDVRREAGSTMLIAVREPWLIEQMGQVLEWFTKNKKGEPAPADPSPIYARTLLSRAEWPFPVLRGVVTAPTLARDGRIIETPGFDPTSGLLVDIAAGSFAPVPPSPTREDAVCALAKLRRPLRKFPFVDQDLDAPAKVGSAEAVALSALLTALVRPSLRTAPMHGYDAPAAGTGKSLCAEMAGLLAMGFRPPALSQGKTAEEDEKRLATVLFAGDPVIHIDNCEEPISGDFLCSMLTQEVVQARILGLSERRVLPSTALVLASGNNLTFAGDTSRRAVICRLDAKVERPDTREFDFDCHEEVLKARPELVVAGLTILRAYHVAKPAMKLTPMGGFNDWEWIRGALVWLGCADPADTRSTILDNDPEKEELIAVLDLWSRAVGSTPTTVAEINTEADEPTPDGQPWPATKVAYVELRSKLTEVACKGNWSAKSVGWWLRRHKDRVIANRCVRMGQHKGRSGQQWHLEQTEPVKTPAAVTQPSPIEVEPVAEAGPKDVVEM
jgi:hypothetical protein